ncbi:hypothetical protein Hanom_Chr16g01501031 [Helianthus anomalus]
MRLIQLLCHYLCSSFVNYLYVAPSSHQVNNLRNHNAAKDGHRKYVRLPPFNFLSSLFNCLSDALCEYQMKERLDGFWGRFI